MDRLAEVFPPGDFIQEELDARGWTQGDLADVMGRPVETVNRLIKGRLAITPETARGLGAAFGTSAQMWMNLDSSYQLAQTNSDDAIARRSKVYGTAPVKDMVKRGWIESSSNADVLERQILEFFEIDSIDDDPTASMAARKSANYSAMSAEQIAWFYCAKKMARNIHAERYTKPKLVRAFDKIRALAIHPNEARRLPEVLGNAGVRMVVVEHLPKSKIDGAAFWVECDREKQPVVAVSLRYDRIDAFWHTLVHEIGHIIERDHVIVDTNLVGSEVPDDDVRPPEEKRADAFASGFLVPPEELEDFINRVRPLYSKQRIVGFANRIGIHPGIIVGQLQHQGEIGFSHSREMLVKIRDIVTSTAHTDGLGHGSAV
jgi:HTH-type transcriptional regulator/antitoxin HigA